ncbi:hypothetical protein B0H19DRAFT_140452 [Mycena capillaripes]|nr:hypothetical protein B0H19DRAFT_140452 [Mycena capillaripes]
MNDGVNYGHAAVIAYTTYQNPIFLEYAKQVWWAVQTYTISQKELDVGTTPLKNFTLEPTCEGITMAGGTFREKSFTSPNINVEATGSFLVLSALLAEATNDTLYLNAAKASADFIRAHLYSVQNLVQDTISGRAIDSCALSEETVAGSYNSGLFIEGLAILYSITQNASIHDMIAQTVTAAIGYPGWQGSNGIIANGAAKQSDMLFPRGLATVNARNASTPALRSYIDAYLSVQFNAVIDLATTTGTNIYALDWNGPPSSSFKPANQTNAIQVLVNAINLNQPAPTSNPTSSSSGSATSPPPSSTSSPPSPPVIHKSSKVGPIVGGVIGGLVLLLGILVGLFLWHRRSRNRASSSAGRTAIAPAINPYDLRFNEMPSLPPRSTEFYDPGGPSSLTQGSTSQTGITSTTSSGPPMGEVPVGGLRYPSMNVNEVAEDDEPPDYPATEISRSRRRTGK